MVVEGMAVAAATSVAEAVDILAARRTRQFPRVHRAVAWELVQESPRAGLPDMFRAILLLLPESGPRRKILAATESFHQARDS